MATPWMALLVLSATLMCAWASTLRVERNGAARYTATVLSTGHIAWSGTARVWKIGIWTGHLRDIMFDAIVQRAVSAGLPTASSAPLLEPWSVLVSLDGVSVRIGESSTPALLDFLSFVELEVLNEAAWTVPAGAPASAPWASISADTSEFSFAASNLNSATLLRDGQTYTATVNSSLLWNQVRFSNVLEPLSLVSVDRVTRLNLTLAFLIAAPATYARLALSFDASRRNPFACRMASDAVRLVVEQAAWVPTGTSAPPNGNKAATAWAIAGATIGGCLTLAIIIFAAMRYSGDARAAHLAKLPPVEALETALAAYDEDEDIDPELLTH